MTATFVSSSTKSTKPSIIPWEGLSCPDVDTRWTARCREQRWWFPWCRASCSSWSRHSRRRMRSRSGSAERQILHRMSSSDCSSKQFSTVSSCCRPERRTQWLSKNQSAANKSHCIVPNPRRLKPESITYARFLELSQHCVFTNFRTIYTINVKQRLQRVIAKPQQFRLLVQQ